jgi:threonine synthase
MAADAIKLSNGWTQVVDDDAILSAQRLLARQTGIFAEPAAAASMAGYLASQQRIPQGKQVVLLITGHGLKDVAAAARGLL